MYEKLVQAAEIRPVEGNAAGAFLTMASAGGLMFGIINIVGNFGTVFVDQAYWQRAIAAQTRINCKGFLTWWTMLVCHSIYTCNNDGADGGSA